MYLFPNNYKRISGWIFLLSVLFGIYYLFFSEMDTLGSEFLTISVPALWHDELLSSSDGFWIENNLFDEILTLIIIISGLLYGFSKEKIEDEYIASMRNRSLAISVYINYTVLIVATLTIYGLPFLQVMMFQLFSILVLFNLIFTLRLKKHYNSELEDEE